jgi:hypothetical protein
MSALLKPDVQNYRDLRNLKSSSVKNAAFRLERV